MDGDAAIEEIARHLGERAAVAREDRNPSRRGASLGHCVAHAELFEPAHRVGEECDACAGSVEARCSFEHGGVDAGAPQRDRDAQTSDAAADDDDSNPSDR